MNDVKFNSSKNIKVINPKTGNPVSSGIVTFMIDPDTNEIIDQTTGTIISGTDLHTSKDEYLLVTSAYGKQSQVGKFSGFSPTEEVFFEDFTWSGRIRDEVGKTVLLSGVDFESLNLATEGVGQAAQYGSTTLSYSGIRVSTELEGSAYFAYRVGSSSDSSIYVEPTVSGSDDISSGRVIFLSKNPGGTSSADHGQVGFAFLRQGTAVNSDGYCYAIFANNANNQFTHRLQRGEINDPGGFDLNEGFDIGLTQNFQWNSAAEREADHRIWYMIEWDAFDSENVLIQISYQLYENGDTIDNIQDTWKPLQQILDNQSPFVTTSATPVWMLVSKDNTAGGDVGIDQLYLEKLPSGTLSGGGLSNWKVIHSNNAAYTTRYSRILNYAQYAFNSLPATSGRNGLPTTAGDENPLVSSGTSIVGLDGRGFGGLEFESIPNDTSVSNRAHAILEPRGHNLTGITKGVIRLCVRFDGGVGTLGHELGIGVLRQGSNPDSDTYTLQLYDAGADQYRVRLRKGPMINSMNISGQRISNSSATNLATSSNLWLTQDNVVWIEFRWEVQGSNTRLEVLYADTVETYNPVDTSPGNVDEKLSQVLTYLDISSPYTSTTLAPSFYLSHALSGANNIVIYQCEIRRSK